MNACKPTCVWVLVNANACGHTHAGLQACPHSDLPAFLLARLPTCPPSYLPADRSACVPACRHTDRRAGRLFVNKQAQIQCGNGIELKAGQCY